jgi:hypothetical protein
VEGTHGNPAAALSVSQARRSALVGELPLEIIFTLSVTDDRSGVGVLERVQNSLGGIED